MGKFYLGNKTLHQGAELMMWAGCCICRFSGIISVVGELSWIPGAYMSSIEIQIQREMFCLILATQNTVVWYCVLILILHLSTFGWKSMLYNCMMVVFFLVLGLMVFLFVYFKKNWLECIFHFWNHKACLVPLGVYL